jgi:NADPH-dependent 2,4-dienoyl-CoA reductase/sulfur reductase-like enzyme
LPTETHPKSVIIIVGGYTGMEMADALTYRRLKVTVVEGLNDIDLSYTPPLSSPYDPIQMSAQEWTQKSLLRE